jgi:hypothetical protein
MSEIRIENIAQAQEAAAAIADFWSRFNQTLSTLGSLTGKSSGAAASLPRMRLDQASGLTSIRERAPLPAPETMPERVFAILKDAPGPLTPKEMTDRYTAFGWPPPKNGKTYSVLLSCAYYLSKRGRLKNNDGRYSMNAGVQSETKI